MGKTKPQDLEQALAEAVAAGGSLAERLKLFAEHFKALRPDYAASYDRLVARLASAGAGATAPRVGDPFPDVMLPDGSGHLRSLGDLLSTGPLVLSFKRGRWCHFCRIEIEALVRAYSNIKALGAEVVVITPERAPEFPTAGDIHGAPFPLLTDVDCGFALTIGIAMPLDQQLVDMLQRDGIRLTESHVGSANILPLPATFVVSPDRRVAARFVSPDFRARMETRDVLAALDDLLSDRRPS
ncbi:MAG: peroxiredoxin-like family protein [Hyphomicrobiaceae bacterium]